MVILLAVFSKPFSSTAAILSAILSAILRRWRRYNGNPLKRVPLGGIFSALVPCLACIYSLGCHFVRHFHPKAPFFPPFCIMVANYQTMCTTYATLPAFFYSGTHLSIKFYNDQNFLQWEPFLSPFSHWTPFCIMAD